MTGVVAVFGSTLNAVNALLADLGSIALPPAYNEVRGGAASGATVPVVAEVLAAGAALGLSLWLLSVLVTSLLAHRPRPDAKAAFFAIFEDKIRGGFPSQPAASMSTVLTGVNSVLRSSPESPCVFLLVGGPNAEATALRLARTLGDAVQTVLQGWRSHASSLELPGGHFASPDDYWLLHETLSRRLEEQRVVIVRDLQAVHPRAATAIAHVCDDNSPPIPQSVLLLLLSPGDYYPTDVGRVGHAEAVVVAERCLVDCWLAREPPPSSGAGLPPWASRDVLPSVLGRMTGRAVLVLAEPADQRVEQI